MRPIGGARRMAMKWRNPPRGFRPTNAPYGLAVATSWIPGHVRPWRRTGAAHRVRAHQRLVRQRAGLPQAHAAHGGETGRMDAAQTRGRLSAKDCRAEPPRGKRFTTAKLVFRRMRHQSRNEMTESRRAEPPKEIPPFAAPSRHAKVPPGRRSTACATAAQRKGGIPCGGSALRMRLTALTAGVKLERHRQ